MFARNVSLRLKSNSIAEFTRIVDEQVIPTLRKQKGFQDEITFLASDETNVIAISLWDSRENAEAYVTGAEGYPTVLKALDKILDGVPKVHFANVIQSTCHKIVAVSGKTIPAVQPVLVAAAVPVAV